MSQALIPPTVGRVVWFYPSRLTGEAGFAPASGTNPLAAVIAHVWSETLVNLAVFDANGKTHSRTSVKLIHEEIKGDWPTEDFCTWMPFQKGQAKAQDIARDSLPPAADAHIRNVLYCAIRDAMGELGELHPGFNDHVNRAWNHLHRAFWNEVPAPAWAAGLREPLPSAEPAFESSDAAASGPGPLRVVTKAEHTAVERLFEAKGQSGRISPSIVRETIAARRYHAFEQVEAHRIQVAKHETNLAKEKCDHRDAARLLSELDQWLADNPAPVRAA